MLYMGYFSIVNGQNIKKLWFGLENFPFLRCRGSGCRRLLQFVRIPNATEPHTNSNFPALGGAMARVWARQPLSGSLWVFSSRIVTK